jgi:hypothetical protein
VSSTRCLARELAAPAALAKALVECGLPVQAATRMNRVLFGTDEIVARGGPCTAILHLPPDACLLLDDQRQARQVLQRSAGFRHHHGEGPVSGRASGYPSAQVIGYTLNDAGAGSPPCLQQVRLSSNRHFLEGRTSVCAWPMPPNDVNITIAKIIS